MVSSGSEAAAFGYGLFETMKYEDGNIYFLEEHYRRLLSGCQEIGLTLGYSLDCISKYCREVVLANSIESGALKLSYSKNKEHHYIIISVRENSYRQEHYDRGFRLRLAKSKRNPYSILTYIKSNNYLENLLERQRAVDMGFDEVLFENIHGKLCEGAISNIFFVKQSILYTPSIECGLMPGIIRKKVIDISKGLGLTVKPGEYEREQLDQAEEIFLTNSLMEIMPVSQVEGRKYELKNNTITKTLRSEFDRYKK